MSNTARITPVASQTGHAHAIYTPTSGTVLKYDGISLTTLYSRDVLKSVTAKYAEVTGSTLDCFYPLVTTVAANELHTR